MKESHELSRRLAGRGLLLLLAAVYWGQYALCSRNVAAHASGLENKNILEKRAFRLAQRDTTQSPPSRADILIREAEILKRDGKYIQAIDKWEEILGLLGGLDGHDQSSIATILHSLADLYVLQENPKKAQALYELALGIREKVLGSGDLVTAITQSTLASLYARLGDLSKAELLYKRSLSTIEAIFGPNHLNTATNLNNLAELYVEQGRYGDAESLHKRALYIRRGILGPDHLDTANSLANLSALYGASGQSQEAERLNLASLAIFEKALGSNHPSVATSLNNLAVIYAEDGRYSEAEATYRRVLATRERVLGAEHPDTASTLNNLAVLYSNKGRYADAESFHRRALFVREKTLGMDHFQTANSISNLAVLYEKQGRDEESELLHKRALGIREKILGDKHPDIAISLGSLAVIYEKSGRYVDAEGLYLRSLRIFEAALGAEHALAAGIVDNLAVLHTAQGRFREAEALYKRSLAISEKNLGGLHPNVGLSLNNLAALYVLQGRFAEARPLYERSLAIAEEALGPNHPITASRMASLVLLALLQKRGLDGLSLFDRLSRTQDDWLYRELPVQPRDLRFSLLRTQTDLVALAFELLHEEASTAVKALQTRLNRQGLLAEIEQRQRLLYGGSKSTRDLTEKLAGLDRQLASVNLTKKQRQQLRTDRQQLETQLYQQLPALRIDGVTNEQVAAVLRELAPQGLLVEFQRYRPLLRSKTGVPEWGEAQYVALTLRPDGRITAINLGEAAPIDTAIAKALDSSAKAHTDALVLWGQVSQLLLTPLKSELKGVQELFLSPDSELNRIPFAVLPVGDDTSKLLSDVVQLRILTTGRDLVRLKSPAQAGASAAVVMANPQFDARSRRSVPANSSLASASATTRQQRSAAQQAGRRQWDPLPATEKEAQALAPLLKADKPITGDAATASWALALKSPRILHIASHGFFDPEQPAVAKQRPTGGQLLGLANPSPLSEDPLLRSGIVLAGANHPDADPNDDGHLTAAEITGMDLRQTELVTLSACETGLGSVRSGEGVYGLQRALTVAGSRSTLLSLWKVDDEATAAFMTEFYRRLMAGEGRADALRNTQAAFRTHSNEEYRDVYVWGAFQLTGDWRPLSAR